MIEYRFSWKPTLLMLALTIFMLFLPSTFNPKIYPNTERVPVKIIKTDESSIKITGMIQQGEQT